jgi:hypothetical protein
MNYIFFYAAIRHNRLEELHTLIYQYIDASAACIIGLEEAVGVHQNTDGEHIHVAVDMTETIWKNFYQTLKNKFNLGGKNSKDKDKNHYGRIKPEKVRDITRFLAYTVKDKNIWSRNVDLCELQSYIDVSFPKQDDMELKVYNYLELDNYTMTPRDQDIERYIGQQTIQYYRQNNLKILPTRLMIKRITLRYLMSNHKIPSDHVYNFMYM